MGKFIDLTGQRFGFLVVQSRAENYERFSKTHNRVLKYARWNCMCDCGSPSSAVLASDLKSGSQFSCGCVRDAKAADKCRTHGESHRAEYITWLGIKDRCNNVNAEAYPKYGGAGITVYSGWVDDFIAFFNYIGEKPDKSQSIDRIDSRGSYEPGNVKWSSKSEQAQNTQKPKGSANRYQWVGPVSRLSWRGQFRIDGQIHKTPLMSNERDAAVAVYLLYKDVMGFYPRYWDAADIADLGLPSNE